MECCFDSLLSTLIILDISELAENQQSINQTLVRKSKQSDK